MVTLTSIVSVIVPMRARVIVIVLVVVQRTSKSNRYISSTRNCNIHAKITIHIKSDRYNDIMSNSMRATKIMGNRKSPNVDKEQEYD